MFRSFRDKRIARWCCLQLNMSTRGEHSAGPAPLTNKSPACVPCPPSNASDRRRKSVTMTARAGDDLTSRTLGGRMTTPLEALAYLSRQDPTPQCSSAFFIEVNAEKNDRGAAILLGANAEVCLRYAIKRHLIKVDDAERTLFHSSGPLRSFKAKIRIEFTARLFGKQTKQNLDLYQGYSERLCARYNSNKL